MKATRQLRPGAPRAEGGFAPSTKSARARGFGGNHTRLGGREKFEAEADAVAERALRGDRGVARALARAPAASARVEASAPAPLPRALRGELEDALGADLAAVRVHRDAAAAAAARAAGARAFTAGRDIYFGAGAYDPAGEAGRRLLLHEITHVLQQTGRRGPDGRLSATAAAGPGDVQLKADWVVRTFTDNVELKGLGAAHIAGATDAAIPLLQAELRKLEARLGPSLSTADPAAADALALTVLDGDYDPPQVGTGVRALVHDCLKALGQVEAAAHLLAADPTMKTAAHSEEVGARAVALIGRDWVFKQLGREPFKQYYPWQFVDTFRRFLLGPTRSNQSLHAPTLGDFKPLRDKLKTEAGASVLPIENELFFLALNDLFWVDEGRIRMISAVETYVKDHWHSDSEVVRRYRMALRTRDSLAKFKEGSEAGRISVPIFAKVIDDCIKVAERAVAVWEEGIIIYEQIVAGVERRPGAEVTAALLKFGARPELKPFRKSLTGALTRLFALNNGSVPTAAAYHAAVTRLKGEFKNLLLEGLELKLIQLSRARRDFDIELAQAYGVLLLWLPELAARLGEYDFEADRKFVSGLPDVRVAHRIRTAGWLAAFSPLVGWPELEALARPVLDATQKGLVENQVALLGEWEADARVTIEQLADADKGKGFSADVPLEGMGLLTSRDIATVFRIEYYETVTREIQRILVGNGTGTGEEGDFSAYRRPTLERIHATLASFKKPKRFLLRDSEKASRPAAAAQAGTAATPEPKRSRAYELVMAHPKTARKLAEEGATLGFAQDKPFVLRPVRDPGRGEELYFWVIPPLKPVVERLQKVNGLDQIVRLERQVFEERVASSGDEGEKAAAAELSKREPWYQWLTHFTRLDPGALEAFRPDVTDLLSTQREAAGRNMIDMLRRATTQDRKLLVKFKVRPKLENYSKHDISTWSDPLNALEEIYDFAFRVSPPGDRDLHFAAIFLELFRKPVGGEDDLVPKFKGIERYDLIISYQTALRIMAGQVKELRPALGNVLPAGERADQTWVDESLARIDEVVQAMERQKVKVQLQYGFVGIKGKGGEDKGRLGSVSSPGSVEAGEAFQIDGISYSIVQVFENFEFHNDYGSAHSPAYTPSVLFVNGVEVRPEARTKRLLLRVVRAGKVLDVYETSDGMLEELSNAVAMQVIIQNLSELADFIEAAAQAMLELAEFIPGVGQAVMAARLATTIISFIMGGEFEDIKQKLFVEPAEVFEKLKEFLKGDFFTPEKLVRFLLFGEDTLAPLASIRPSKVEEPKTETRRKNVGRFGKLIRRVHNLGPGMFSSLGKVRGSAQRGILVVHNFVGTRPALLFMLQLADNYYEDLRLAAERAGEAGADDLAEAVAELPEHVGQLIESVNEMEIPKQLVPLGEMLEIIIEIVVDKLGGKYELAAEAILYALDKLGYKDDLFDAVAARIADAGLDPNQLWVEVVEESLQPRFEEYRAELVGTLNDFFSNIGVPLMDAGKVPAAKVEATAADFPESAPYPSGRPPEPDAAQTLPPPGAGAPLAAGVRLQAERRFGHDFSHVRLHAGGEAARVTRGLGADGLATGSHVYVRPGLALSTGHGAEVLDHELAHVLQQTGPRPLGGAHSDRPTLGRPRGGLNYSPSHEAAAERTARAARRGGAATRPVAVGPAGAGGFQPLFSAGTTRRMLRTIIRGEAIASHYRKLAEEEAGPPVDQRLTGELAAEVANLGPAVWAMIESDTQFVFDEPFKSVRATLLAPFFKGKFSGVRLKAIFNSLAAHSLVEKTDPQAPAGDRKKPAPKVWDLNVRLFQQSLEGFLFEATGFAVRLTFNGEKKPGGRFKIDPAKPLLRARLSYVHMPALGGDAKAWGEVIQNTFGPAPGSPDRQKYQPRVRVYLTTRGPAPGIWDRKRFAFSDAVREEIEGSIKLGTSGQAFPPDQLPEKKRYLATDPSAGPDKVVGHVGLRLGLYKDNAQTGPDSGHDRESHHMTQFLLLEYFRNWKQAKPFRHDPDLYRDGKYGLETGGGLPKSFSRRGGGTIDIATLAGEEPAKRGPEMPVISVAAVTHRRGSLHIQGEPDEGPARKPTQGGAVQNRFREGFKSDRVASAVFAKKDDQLRELAGDAAGRQQVNEEVYNAMQHTYQWVRGDMMGRLLAGLTKTEADYYNTIAQARTGGQTGDYTLTGPDLVEIKARAQAHNDEVMKSYGWLAK